MLDLDPEQRKQLGAKLSDFVANYPPNQPEAILFVDDSGAFDYSAGPEAPAGCRPIMDRGGVDRLMVGHGYLALDFAQPDTLAEFVDLLWRNRFAS